jgi:hypothetical protein
LGRSADSLYKNPSQQQLIADKEKTVYSGFSAQQVEQLAKNIGYDFSGVQVPQNDKQHYSISYADFVVPIVKSIQEQQVMIEKMQKTIELLQKENSEMKKQLQR